jgi:hypothetical protein
VTSVVFHSSDPDVAEIETAYHTQHRCSTGLLPAFFLAWLLASGVIEFSGWNDGWPEVHARLQRILYLVWV